MRIHSVRFEKVSNFLKRHSLRSIGVTFCAFCLVAVSIFSMVAIVKAVNNQTIVDASTNKELLTTGFAWNKINTGMSLDADSISASDFTKKKDAEGYTVFNGTRTTEGTGGEKIILNYNKNGGIGEINGRAVGVKIEMTGFKLKTFRDTTTRFIDSFDLGNIGLNADTMIVLIYKNFWNGIRVANILEETESYELYYLDNGAKIDLKDSWVSYNSMSTYEGVQMYSADNTNFTTAIAKDTTVEATGNGKYWGLTEMWENEGQNPTWDNINNVNYTRGTVAQKLSTSNWKVTYFVDGRRFSGSGNDGVCYRTESGGTVGRRCTEQRGVSYLHMPSVAPLIASVPKMPEKFAVVGSQKVKTVTNVAPNNELTFETSQQVEYKGYTGGLKYKQFAIVDVLPEELDYKTSSAVVYMTKQDGTKSTVDASNYTVTASGRNVRVEFKSNFLQNVMPYELETYTLQIKATANNKAISDKVFNNVGYSIVNDKELDHSAVDIATVPTVKTPKKFAVVNGQKTDTVLGIAPEDEITFETSQQVEHKIYIPGSKYRQFALVDVLPEELDYKNGSAVVYMTKQDGTKSTVDASNYNVTVNGKNVLVEFKSSYLNAMPYQLETYTLQIKAIANEKAIPNKIFNNIGYAIINDGKLEDSIIDIVTKEEKHGYEVTAYKKSVPESGSLVKAGDEIKYEFEIENTGADVAPYTVLRDYLPKETSYVDDSATDDGVYVPADENHAAYVEWVIQNIAPSSNYTMSYSVTVADEYPVFIVDNAYYMDYKKNPGKAGEIVGDPEHITNTIIHKTNSDIPVGTILDLRKYSKPLPGSKVGANEIIEYKLELFNNGDTDTTTAGIRDYIPEGTEIILESISGGGIYNKENNSVEWKNESVKSGESKEFMFSVKVTNEAKDIVVNQGLFENDWDGVNNPHNSSNIIEHVFAPEIPDTGSSTVEKVGGNNGGKGLFVSVAGGVAIALVGWLIVRKRHHVDFRK